MGETPSGGTPTWDQARSVESRLQGTIRIRKERSKPSTETRPPNTGDSVRDASIRQHREEAYALSVKKIRFNRMSDGDPKKAEWDKQIREEVLRINAAAILNPRDCFTDEELEDRKKHAEHLSRLEQERLDSPR